MVHNREDVSIRKLDQSHDVRLVGWYFPTQEPLLILHSRHGSWDSPADQIGSNVYAHTSLTEIKDALNLLWRNNVPADKIKQTRESKLH